MASPVARCRLLKALVVLALLGGVGALLGRLAWGHYHQRAAGRAMGRRDFAEARRRLAKYLSVWPSDGATLLLAARAARRDGDAADAKAVPEAVAFERELARLQAGDLAGADRDLAACDAHREKPETALLLEALTDGALRAMQLDFARRCLEVWDAARPEPPDRTQAKIWRGELAYRKGETDLALVHSGPIAAAWPWFSTSLLPTVNPGPQGDARRCRRRTAPA